MRQPLDGVCVPRVVHGNLQLHLCELEPMHHRLGLSSDDGAAIGFGSLGGTNQASLIGTLAYDTFHDVNGVALSEHTMNIGNGWFAQNSDSAQIESNQLTGSDYGSYELNNAPGSNITISATCSNDGSGTNGGDDVGIFFRDDNSDNGYFLYLDTPNHCVTLQKADNNVYSTVGQGGTITTNT